MTISPKSISVVPYTNGQFIMIELTTAFVHIDKEKIFRLIFIAKADSMICDIINKFYRTFQFDTYDEWLDFIAKEG